MRSVRMTYEGALHHVINRGKDGLEIFSGNRNKLALLEFLKVYLPKYKLRLFGYCIMDNECHLVMENTNGHMPDFLKQINGQFGMLFRKRTGIQGNVYHDRYKSILIQDESYLKIAFGHILSIPVTLGVVDTADEYIWSSIGDYFSKKESDLVDYDMFRRLFGSKKHFRHFLKSDKPQQYSRFLFRTERYGYILGEKSIVDTVAEKNEERIETGKMRKTETPESIRKQIESMEKIIADFEKTNNLRIEGIDTHRFSGKRLRAQLLVELKEKAGVTFPRIHQVSIFKELKLGSLGRLYKRAKENIEEDME